MKVPRISVLLLFSCSVVLFGINQRAFQRIHLLETDLASKTSSFDRAVSYACGFGAGQKELQRKLPLVFGDTELRLPDECANETINAAQQGFEPGKEGDL